MPHACFGAQTIVRGARAWLMASGLLLLAPAAHAANYYVDGLRGDQSNPGTSARPFKFFWQSMQVVKPGDTVYVLPTIVYPHMSISVSGASGKPITLVGAGTSGAMTKVIGENNNFALWVNANYVEVRNFDLRAPGRQAALHVSENHHHVTIANNVTHDSGGNGISTVGDDYITISHNIVYGNAKNTSGNVFNSGISTLGNIDIDGNTGVKMIIDGNIVYGNTNTPSCSTAACLATWQNSDGNGIIIDDLRRVQRDNIPYRGRTLISNNVVFGNGGRGIHIYLSDHVTATGNTVYFNNQDPYEGNYRPGEIQALFASDVDVYNNVLVSDGGTGLEKGKYTGTHVPLSFEYCAGAKPVTGRFNVVFNAKGEPISYFGRNNNAPVTVSDNTWSDPLLLAPSLDPLRADFRLRPGSPALGMAHLPKAPAADAVGSSRGAKPSVGAYQNAVSPLPQFARR